MQEEKREEIELMKFLSNLLRLWVMGSFLTQIPGPITLSSSFRDERLPKGPSAAADKRIARR
jgi:hypothetical protein